MLKKSFILFGLVLTLLNSELQGQTFNTSYLSYNSIEIVNYSVKFSFSSSGTYSYYAPYISSQYVLANLQSRYDYYHSIVSEEYHKLNGLTLINRENQETLQAYKEKRLNWIVANIKKIDFTNVNYSNKTINYLCEIYSYPSIKSELSLLKAINLEIKRLAYKYPGEYHKTERYKELGLVLSKLANCSTSEIGRLAWDYGLN